MNASVVWLFVLILAMVLVFRRSDGQDTFVDLVRRGKDCEDNPKESERNG